MKIHKKKFLLLLIMVLLLIIPIFFWGGLYIVGGDDTRLYYVFPWDFLSNFCFKISSDNALGTLVGYYPKNFWVPIIFIIFLLKQIPFVNVQLLMYGLNLSFGFLFFYLFLGLWLLDLHHVVYIKITSSLFYIFSTYLLKTFYINQLLSIYLVTALPATLYFFIKGLRERKIFFTVISVVIYSCLSSTFISLPWSAALLITLIPLFIALFIQYRKIFVMHAILFSFLFLLLNFYWMIFHIDTFLSNQISHPRSVVTYYFSKEFRESNIKLISSVYNIFDPLNRVFNERDTQLANHFSLNVLLKIIYLTVIILAGIYLSRVNKSLKNTYLLSLICLLLAFFFFQPNIGNWSLNLFIFLNNHIPFFSMFRNMSDKFSFSLAFSYAFSLGISLTILSLVFKKLLVSLLLSFSVIIIVVNAFGFIFPKYADNNFSIRVSGQFNNDFRNLIKYLNANKTTARVLWYPLNYPSYIYIEDKYNKNHYYFGPSILKVLIGQSDYAGFLSLGNAIDPDLGDKILSMMRKKQYEDIGMIFKRLNIGYIIENKQKLPTEQVGFLYSQEIVDIQGKDMRSRLFGKKLNDFGTRYSLYKINEKFRGEKIYFANSQDKNQQFIKYQKNTDVDFNIYVKNFKGQNKLILQDPYNSGWDLYVVNTKNMNQYKLGQGISYEMNYANAWNLDSAEIYRAYPKTLYAKNNDGSINIALKLYFSKQRLLFIGNAVSLITFIGVIGYLFFFTYDVCIKYLRSI